MSTINPDGSISLDATGLQPYARPEVKVEPFSIGQAVTTITIATQIQASRPPKHHADVLHLRAHPSHLRAMAHGILDALDAADPDVADVAARRSTGSAHGDYFGG